ncbi:MAG: phosphate signaling complex protein PhoU [Roseiflexaceae bacterium]|nr:phosphate signaling complex protein PhoU [Roseiflexaceae bacterium]
MRSHFTKQLQQINDDLLRMGSRVEHALVDVGHLLESRDTDLAQRIIAGDREVDAARSAIEEEILDIIAMQQPVATDLRRLLATIAIANELERAADYAKGIAKRVIRGVSYERLVDTPPQLRQMASIALTMLNTSLDAFVRNDAALARTLSTSDEEVDQLDDDVSEQLRDLARNDPGRLDAVLAWLDVAHVLERLADRATNIGERVIFIATSQNEELNP